MVILRWSMGLRVRFWRATGAAAPGVPGVPPAAAAAATAASETSDVARTPAARRAALLLASCDGQRG